MRACGVCVCVCVSRVVMGDLDLKFFLYIKFSLTKRTIKTPASKYSELGKSFHVEPKHVAPPINARKRKCQRT